jgi:hypothetical protein
MRVMKPQEREKMDEEAARKERREMEKGEKMDGEGA